MEQRRQNAKIRGIQEVVSFKSLSNSFHLKQRLSPDCRATPRHAWTPRAGPHAVAYPAGGSDPAPVRGAPRPPESLARARGSRGLSRKAQLSRPRGWHSAPAQSRFTVNQLPRDAT